MIPVLGLSSAFLFEQTCFILNNIRKAGGNPVAIIVDGNRVNQSFFYKIDLTKPWLTNDGIVLLYDYVHLLKNVRNNWITEATKEINFVHEGKILTARWHDLEELLKLEEGNLVKLSKLTKVSVYPTPIERQKVLFVLQIFCEKTVAALKVHEGQLNCEGTIIFISKIIKIWKIMNVKSMYEEIRFNDPTRVVIRSVEDSSMRDLTIAAEFISAITSESGKRQKQLTKDTGYCFTHTCKAMIELARYHLDQDHEYVPLGKASTDPLEKEFGKLRQGSGGTYFITVQQILEKVSINKTKLLLTLNCSKTS